MPKIQSKRKKRNREEVQDEIVRYLGSIDHPTTTTEIAHATGLNWYTAIANLSMLKGEGKIFHKKIGRQDQWFDVNVNDTRRLAKKLRVTTDKQRKEIHEQEKLIEKQSKKIEKLEDKTEKQDEIIRNQDKRIQELESS